MKTSTLIEKLPGVFDEASTMYGSYHPHDMVRCREEVEELRRETMKRLRIFERIEREARKMIAREVEGVE